MITTVTEGNRVVIPVDLARTLNIKAGTRLEWFKDDEGMLRAKPLPSRGKLADRLHGMGRTWLESDDDPIAQLVEERVREDEEEAAP